MTLRRDAALALPVEPAVAAQQPARQRTWTTLEGWTHARHDEGRIGLWRWPSGILVSVQMVPGKGRRPRYMFRLDGANKATFRPDIEFDRVRLYPQGASK